MNSEHLIGRITHDLELKAIPSGLKVVNFCVAVRRKTKNGETDFIDCTAWDKTAELLVRDFRKGSMIGVEGELRTQINEYKGGKVKKYFVNVEQISYMGNKTDIDVPAPSNSPIPQAQTNYVDIEEIGGNSDLPF